MRTFMTLGYPLNINGKQFKTWEQHDEQEEYYIEFAEEVIEYIEEGYGDSDIGFTIRANSWVLFDE